MTQPVWTYLQGLYTFGGDQGITLGALTGGIAPASTTFPAANDAIFVPFYLNQAVLIKRLYSQNGTAVSGNIDVGIYAQDGAKITSSGSTAQAGTNALQFFDITDITLGPGRYYFAVALDNTTGTLFRANLALARLQALGCAKMATAFALPATATFATVTATFLPAIGADISAML